MERRWAEGSRKLSTADLAELQRRVAAGETYEVAAAAVGCSTKSLQRFMRRTGGVFRGAPTRSPRRLSLADREELSRGLRAGESFRQIASRMGRAPSTISREVAANGRREDYRAWRAERTSSERCRRPKPCKLDGNDALRREVEVGLINHWSPKQIAVQLRQDYPRDPAMWVSHETVYRSLFIQARGSLRKELTAYLRTGRTRRQPHGRSRPGAGQLSGMINISQRPAEAEDRAVPGHWEGDLIIGQGGRSAIGTLVERSTRYVMLFRLPNGRTAEDVRLALTKRIQKLPVELRRSLTWDQGKEMAEHVRFSVDAGIQVYFCDPHSPWQRGSNENTNGLLRQYFPRNADLSVFAQQTLDAVARQLNGRPRQTLGWVKPSVAFARAVASTA